MIGNYLFGTQLFGTGPGAGDVAYAGLFSYNGYSFETTSVRVGDIENIEDLDKYTFNTFKTAREDGEGFVSRNIDRKKIVISGVLRADSVSELQAIMQAMKQALFVPNSPILYRRQDGVMVESTGSCTGLEFQKRFFNITFMPFQVTIETIDPFFYGTDQQIASWTGQSATLTDTVTNLVGNYKAKPVISITFLTGNVGVTVLTVILNGQIISLTGTFDDADIVNIDCNTKDVSLNSVGGQAYTGTFGDLDIGATDIEVSMNGTFDVDIYVLRYGTYV